MALIDGESFKVGDYFDVLENEWSLTNLEASLLNGQSLCINLKK